MCISSHSIGRGLRCGLLGTCLALAFGFAAAQTGSTLHIFPASSPDGFSPSSGLVADTHGSLYGVTQTGGISCSVNVVGCGIAYKLSPPASGSGFWRETILYSFTGGADGALPQGNLLIDNASHVIYGTGPLGGSKSFGVVFAINPGITSTETVIYNFKGPEGGAPTTGVTMHNGNLYGAANGGTFSAGTIYRLRPPSTAGGAWREQTLYQFTFGADGGFPFATPIVDSAGNIYGTAFNSPSGAGTVYELSPPSGGVGPWTFSTLYSFTGGDDGGNPRGGVVMDGSGALYGTTQVGGTDGWGTVFKLTPPVGGSGPWTETVLYSFTGRDDGGTPWAGVTLDGAGNLWGATAGGGNVTCGSGGGCGAVFELSPPSAPGGSWTETVDYVFNVALSGEEPLYAPLLLNGNVYGTTTAGGGKKNGGVAFEVTP